MADKDFKVFNGLLVKGPSKILGALNINDAYSFPVTLGNAGYALISDGTGTVYWGSTSPTGAVDSSNRIEREIHQPSHGFTKGNAVFFDGNEYKLAISDNINNLGVFLVGDVIDSDTFNLVLAGFIEGLSGLNPGSFYFVSPAVSGAITSVEPSAGYSNPILLAESATTGYVLPWRAGAVEYGINKIVEDNTRVEVIDTGTEQRIEFVLNGIKTTEIDTNGNLVPGAHGVYSLGTSAVGWKHLYLSSKVHYKDVLEFIDNQDNIIMTIPTNDVPEIQGKKVVQTEENIINFYLSPTGNDDNDGLSEFYPKKTFSSVFKKINNKFFAYKGQTIINLAEGIYTSTDLTIYNNSNLSIYGIEPIITFIESIKNRKNNLVTFKVEDATDIHSGNYVIISKTRGDSLHEEFEGCFKIIRVKKNLVTCEIPDSIQCKNITSGAFIVLKSVLKLKNGLKIKSKLKYLTNIVILSDEIGIELFDKSYIRTGVVGIIGGQIGIKANNAKFVNDLFISIAQCKTGIHSIHSDFILEYCSINNSYISSVVQNGKLSSNIYISSLAQFGNISKNFAKLDLGKVKIVSCKYGIVGKNFTKIIVLPNSKIFATNTIMLKHSELVTDRINNNGNIILDDNSICNLKNSKIVGNIDILKHSILLARQANIAGNILCKYSDVHINYSTVKGKINLNVNSNLEAKHLNCTGQLILDQHCYANVERGIFTSDDFPIIAFNHSFVNAANIMFAKNTIVSPLINIRGNNESLIRI